MHIYVFDVCVFGNEMRILSPLKRFCVRRKKFRRNARVLVSAETLRENVIMRSLWGKLSFIILFFKWIKYRFSLRVTMSENNILIFEKKI